MCLTSSLPAHQQPDRAPAPHLRLFASCRPLLHMICCPHLPHGSSCSAEQSKTRSGSRFQSRVRDGGDMLDGYVEQEETRIAPCPKRIPIWMEL